MCRSANIGLSSCDVIQYIYCRPILITGFSAAVKNITITCGVGITEVRKVKEMNNRR